MKNNRFKYIILIFVLWCACLEVAYAQPGCDGCDKKNFGKKKHKTNKYTYNHYANNSTAGNHGEEGEDSYDDWGDDGDDDDESGDDDDDDGGGGSSAGVQDPTVDKRCFELLGKTNREPNPNRMVVGIGEFVTVTPVIKERKPGGVVEIVKTAFCEGDLFKWTIINENGAEAYISLPIVDGNIALTKQGGSISINSGYVPGRYIVKAEYISNGGQDCPQKCPYQVLYYDVIAPEEVVYTLIETSCKEVPHVKDKPSANMLLRMTLKPDNVNFGNVEIKETKKGDKNEWDADGFHGFGQTYHRINSSAKHDEHMPTDKWLEGTNSVIPKYGTEMLGYDKVSMSFECSKSNLGPFPNLTGFHQWTIPYVYHRIHRDGSSEEVSFCTVIQRADNFEDKSGNKNPEFILSKGWEKL